MNLLCFFCKSTMVDKTCGGYRFTCPNCSDDFYQNQHSIMINEEHAFSSYSPNKPISRIFTIVAYIINRYTIYEAYAYYIKINDLVLEYDTSRDNCIISDPKNQFIAKFPRNFELFDLSPLELYNKLKLYVTFS